MDRLLNVSTMQSGNGCTRLQPLTRCTRNNALKQQTSYLCGKENIHQAMVKTKWNQYGDTKVTFLSEPGEIYTGGMNTAGHFYYICRSAITGNILKRVV